MNSDQVVRPGADLGGGGSLPVISDGKQDMDQLSSMQSCLV
jgi:hypothetical protein